MKEMFAPEKCPKCGETTVVEHYDTGWRCICKCGWYGVFHTELDIDHVRKMWQSGEGMMKNPIKKKGTHTEILHRQPKDLDIAEPKGNLTHCQWCGVTLDPTSKVWHCVARLDHYLVCDDCHDQAIVH